MSSGRPRPCCSRKSPCRSRVSKASPRGIINRVKVNLPWNEPVLAAKHYVALTPDQVKAAFAKWVRPGDLVQVTQGPAPQ